MRCRPGWTVVLGALLAARAGADVPIRCPAPSPAQAAPSVPAPAALVGLFEAVHSIEFASHVEPSDAQWQSIAAAVVRAAALSPASLSTRQRVIGQNAAIQLVLRTHGATTPGPLAAQREALRLVGAWALTAPQLEALGSDPAPTLEPWLGPRLRWIELTHSGAFFHEGLYLGARVSRILRAGERRAVFSQLVAIDTAGRAHVTPLVGEVEMRFGDAADAPGCVLVESLDERSALRPLQPPAQHLGGFIRLGRDGGDCDHCHHSAADRAPVEAMGFTITPLVPWNRDGRWSAVLETLNQRLTSSAVRAAP